MKTVKKVFRKSLFIRLAILAVLTIGVGNSALADDTFTISFEGLSGSDSPTDWTASYHKYENNYIIGSNTWSTYTLTSNSSYTLKSGQQIVITAKGLSTSSAKVGIYFSTNSTSASFSSNATKEFTTELRVDTSNDYEITYTNTNDRTCYIKFSGYYAAIKKIDVKASLSELTVIDENLDPGEFKNCTPAALTVKYTAVEGWNTICMPIILRNYSINHMSEIFGTEWKAYTLSNYNSGILTFSPVAGSGYINANIPLLVYAPNATGIQTYLSLSNENVTYSSSPKATAGDATFQGTYAPISMEGKFGVTSFGQVMEGTSTADIKGYRAYFTGISAPSDGSRPTIVFEDDDDVQGLSAVMWMENTQEAYNLQGQKVEKGRKGIYIVNGRKVVIK